VKLLQRLFKNDAPAVPSKSYTVINFSIAGECGVVNMAKETSKAELTEKHKNAFCALTELKRYDPRFHTVQDAVETHVSEKMKAWSRDNRIEERKPSSEYIANQAEEFRKNTWSSMVEYAERMNNAEWRLSASFFRDDLGFLDTKEIESLDSGLRNYSHSTIGPVSWSTRGFVAFFKEFAENAEKFKEKRVSTWKYLQTVSAWIKDYNCGSFEVDLITSNRGMRMFLNGDIKSWYDKTHPGVPPPCAED